MRQLEVRLKPWESRRLRQLRDHAPSARIVKRAMCLLLSAAGEAAKAIARVTGLSPDAVTDVRRRWRSHRLRSLDDRPRSGRPPTVTPAYRRELRRALRSGPRPFGYVFTTWSVARLAAHLHKTTGVRVGPVRLRQLIHAAGFGIGRPAGAHAAEQARPARVRAGATPAGPAKKGALRADAPYELWYADVTTFELLPHLVRCWTPRGRQLKVPTPGKNRKVAAFGALCYGRGLFLYHTQPRATAWGMRALVQRLLSRARRTGRKIMLVLDRGNPNHAKALHRDLELAEPWVEAVWIPHYSWNLNLIERLWKHVKATRVANVLFASVGRFVRHVEAALEDFARHPDLTFGAIKATSRERIRKNLVAVT